MIWDGENPPFLLNLVLAVTTSFQPFGSCYRTLLLLGGSTAVSIIPCFVVTLQTSESVTLLRCRRKSIMCWCATTFASGSLWMHMIYSYEQEREKRKKTKNSYFNRDTHPINITIVTFALLHPQKEHASQVRVSTLFLSTSRLCLALVNIYTPHITESKCSMATINPHVDLPAQHHIWKFTTLSW